MKHLPWGFASANMVVCSQLRVRLFSGTSYELLRVCLMKISSMINKKVGFEKYGYLCGGCR